MSSHDVVSKQADRTKVNKDMIDVFIVMIVLQVNSYTKVEAT